MFNLTNRIEGSDQGSFFTADFLANPYPLFAQLREMAPIINISSSPGHQVWMVTRFNEAVQVLKDNRFSVEFARNRTEYFEYADRAGGGGFILNRSMISVDEPDHSRLRKLVSKGFTPRYIEGLRPRIQDLANELLDKVTNRGEMDLIGDFAYPLPINVISEMMGVPPADRSQIREWSAVIARNYDDPQKEVKLDAFSKYVHQLVAEKRAKPQDDLVSKLVRIEEDGDRLSEQELLSMVALLIFAGHETTSNLIGNGALALFDHPEQMHKLIKDPGLIPSAVEEMLRFCGPVLSPAPRHALEDMEIGGQAIHAGDMVMVIVASANHDPSQFTSPEELEIARTMEKHIAFGQGIHYCLGAPLARLEGEIAFTALLKRTPDIHLRVPREEIQWNASMILRGISTLPVAFTRIQP
jgi:cytochrome P450